MGINLRNKNNKKTINTSPKKKTIINLQSEVQKEISRLADLIRNNKL